MIHIIFNIIFNLFSIHLISQQFEVEGSAKIHEMGKKNLADSVIVWMNDGTLAIRDVFSLVEYQILRIHTLTNPIGSIPNLQFNKLLEKV